LHTIRDAKHGDLSIYSSNCSGRFITQSDDGPTFLRMIGIWVGSHCLHWLASESHQSVEQSLIRCVILGSGRPRVPGVPPRQNMYHPGLQEGHISSGNKLSSLFY